MHRVERRIARLRTTLLVGIAGTLALAVSAASVTAGNDNGQAPPGQAKKSAAQTQTPPAQAKAQAQAQAKVKAKAKQSAPGQQGQQGAGASVRSQGNATVQSQGSKPANGNPGNAKASGNAGEKVTICHATGSATNPYVKISPAASGVFHGHLGGGHQNGEDIIPPFTYNGQTYSQNWPAGQATFNNGCNVPGQPTTASVGQATTLTVPPSQVVTISGAGVNVTTKGKAKVTVTPTKVGVLTARAAGKPVARIGVLGARASGAQLTG